MALRGNASTTCSAVMRCVVVYDNKMGDADDSDAATALGGGSIVIHKGGVGTVAVTAITGATAAETVLGGQIVFTLVAKQA